MTRKTYNYPATKKPYKGTLTFVEKKYSPKVNASGYKTITAPYGSLAKKNGSNKKIA